ncbi:MAG: glycine--tRNA ligase subunit beta [Simkaniaceae bacterium]|nr:glycine--tRNA ligase subunit beta [Candidatus Sacchlamyda saccharinae]
MLTFQEIIAKLFDFWEKQGCIVHQGHDLEMGAGTFNPATFLRSLGPEPYKTAYVEPSRRPSDGRYGETPNRLQLFHQFQVIIKPSPANIIELYKQSLEAIGIDLSKHDLRFVHDDWESPTLGAFGLGWEVWLDGMEVSQFTYFQAVASLPLKPISVEITYGLERLCTYVQNKDNVFDMQWNKDYTYGDITKQNEVEWSSYNFTHASTEMWFRHFDDYEKEAKDLIAKDLPLPAYDFVIKASHAFNMLDARGVISVTERAGYIGRIRDLARLIGASYLTMREKQGFPLLAKLPQYEAPLPKPKSFPKTFEQHRRETFLLEIGSEPLPATFVPIGMQNLETALRTLFKENNLAFEGIQPFGTPRRLGAIVRGLVEGTADEKISRKGPNVSSAFDEDGNPTKQGAGFLKSLGFETLTKSDIDKTPGLSLQGEYLYAEIEKKGKSIYEILSSALPKLILKLDFPKKMRWGSLDIEFARPIHWITALYDTHLIPFSLGDVTSNSHSFGHAQLDPKKIPLQSAGDYFTLLKDHKVLADPNERRQSILDQLHKLEKELSATSLEQKKVLAQVLHLTEWPQLTHADFNPDYLSIPKEVLICEMVEHQKYFPLSDKAGNLINKFLITADNTPTDLIRAGNQRVLSARLSDGVFLYNQDLKTPLDDFNQKLDKILFQKKLGTVHEKVTRTALLAQNLNDLLQIADPKKVARAAHLCKADLATDMVGEFPELQGTIGKYYALTQKEDPEVATAIEEHWMPRTEGGDLPKTPTGIITALADKLDNLSSYFSVGLKPTSSSDPFALRRQAIGIVKILIENKLSLNLEEQANSEIITYITTRAQGVFEECGFAKDEVQACGLCRNPYDHYCKIKALHAFRKEPTFQKLYEVYKRAKGQLQKGKAGTLDPALLTDPAEKDLHSTLLAMEKTWPNLLKQKSYEEAFTEMAKFQKPLANLFDTVKILADDPAIQGNRLALLNEVFTHFAQLLDFSKIQSK